MLRSRPGGPTGSSRIIGNVQWGSVADLVGAAGTIITVVISVAIAVQQIRERRETQELLQNERDRARRSDADSVSAWVATETKRGRQKSTLHLLNGSPRPIFAVTMIPMTYFEFHRAQRIVCAVVGPGVDLVDDFTADARDLVNFIGGNADVTQRIGVKVIFRDASGQSWERGIDGTLKQRDWNYADDEFPAEPDYSIGSRLLLGPQ